MKTYDEFNEPCLYCKHRADEHIAGNGHCYLCNCGRFIPHTQKYLNEKQKNH